MRMRSPSKPPGAYASSGCSGPAPQPSLGPVIQPVTSMPRQPFLRTPCVHQALWASAFPSAAAAVTCPVWTLLCSIQVPPDCACPLACPETFLLTQRHEMPSGPQSCLCTFSLGMWAFPAMQDKSLSRGRPKPEDAFFALCPLGTVWVAYIGGTWWLLCWPSTLSTTLPRSLTPVSL